MKINLVLTNRNQKIRETLEKSICYKCKYYDWAIIFDRDPTHETVWEHGCEMDKEFVGDEVKECDAFSTKRETRL